MELTEALVTEDITPFERERLREALEEEVRRQLPTDRQLLRVVDWDPGGGHAVEKRSRHEEVPGRVRDGTARLGFERTAERSGPVVQTCRPRWRSMRRIISCGSPRRP